MKNNFKKIVCIILVISILTSAVFSLTSFANDVITYNSSMDKYFSELKDNIPLNAIGSCGYVAMSIMLAYYDTYWNDRFVGSQYEGNLVYDSDSIGSGYITIKTENELVKQLYSQYRELGGTLSEKDFYEENYPDIVEQHQGEGYLHLDLIGMGIENGYYDGIFSKDEYSASIVETAMILDAYFDDIFGEYIYYDPLNLNSVSGNYPPISIEVLKSSSIANSQDSVVQKMYELLDDGIPVMYRGSDSDGSGHRMIAYDVVKDDNGNIIDCEMHTGWVGDFETTLNTTKYNSNIAILWLEIDTTRIPHSCSNNYLLENGNTVCSCDLYGDLHPEHVHKAENGYAMCPAADRTSTCICGEKVVGPHDYSYLNYSSIQHWYECDCGAKTEIESHNNTYTSFTNTTHAGYCECGYSFSGQSHILEYQNVSDLYHKCVCACGYSKTASHTTKAINNRYSECTVCGAVFDMWSDVTIKKADELLDPETE